MKHFSHSQRASFGRVLCTLAITGSISAMLPAAAANQHHPAPVHARANVVIHWNAVAAEAFAPSQGTNPMAQSRTLAILHASIHDALNAIEPRYASYTAGLTAAPDASADAAVAAAAREVLVSLLPEQRAKVDDAYARAIKKVRFVAARDSGIALGRAAALATLARRSTDGADAAARPVYAPRSGAGEYQFTAPFDFAAQPGWGNVQPFVIERRAHLAAGPLAVTSADYAADLVHIKALGRDTSTIRTADQTAIAKFWYEDSPLGWNRIANTTLRQRKVDAWEAARAFALLNFAMADGFIAGFHAKYQHRYWRPVTAIHAAAHDGNPHTVADSSWTPLLITPPVPDYPSTHTVLGWAAAEVLIAVLDDDVTFKMASLTLPGTVRLYRGFSQAAEENGISRLYAGIHFRHAVADGRKQGRRIGRDVAGALAALR